MKKITLTQYKKSVSASFPDGSDLTEVLSTVDGLIKALGYCYDGELGVIETEND